MSSGRLSGFFHHPLLNPWAHRGNERDAWPETVATVADCFNLSDLLNKNSATGDCYSVRFTYWVDGAMHTGCFKTRTKYAQGDTLMVRHDPRRHERNSADPIERFRTELLIAAAVVLIALYFVVASRL
jgi:hypothetical protein